MRVHHLDCVTMCPPGGRLMDGRTGATGPAQLSCHCMLLELSDRLVLVDTGFGLEDVRAPRERLSSFFLDVMCRPQLRAEDTAARQIEKLGFSVTDVRDIVLTHLDFDHAGGLDDFPAARVHLLDAEVQAASAQDGWLKRQRFRPQQWASRPRWITYPSSRGERWHGLEAVRELEGLPPEILFVPLDGHTAGHAGIAVNQGERWLLHAGDAYFHHGEMDPAGYHCPPGLRFYQWFMEVDRDRRLASQARLRELVQRESQTVRVVCAHDLVELDAIRTSWFERTPHLGAVAAL